MTLSQYIKGIKNMVPYAFWITCPLIVLTPVFDYFLPDFDPYSSVAALLTMFFVILFLPRIIDSAKKAYWYRYGAIHASNQSRLSAFKGDYVYLVRRSDGIYKVGRTTRMPRRLLELQVEYNTRITLVAAWRTNQLKRTELAALSATEMYSYNEPGRQELRCMTQLQVLRFVQSFTWDTMVPKALSYHDQRSYFYFAA